MNAAQLGVIQQRCVDASPAIHKQACRSLCALLEMNPQAKELQSAWVPRPALGGRRAHRL